MSEDEGISKNEQSSLSKPSSNLFEGSVALSAQNAEIKERAGKLRDRKVNTWTPVLVWPVGFSKIYAKKTLVYTSEDCLHQERWPLLPVNLVGEIIFNLELTDVEA